MTKDFLVAEDGFTVETWAEGETRETIDQLVCQFLLIKAKSFQS